MGTPLSIEERLSDLETRMTTLEQFREEMRAGHVMIVTELTERIEESKRYARMLHEDFVARIAVIGEGLAANTVGLSDVREGLTTVKEELADVRQGLKASREGLSANVAGIKALDEKLDKMDTGLSGAIEATRVEMRAMFAQVFDRLDGLPAVRNQQRRSKKS